jgi:hypothetical protein
MAHRLTSWRGERNFNLEIARGVVNGFSLVSVFGRNPVLNTSTYEDVWYSGGLITYLTVAVELRIKAGGNVADTAAGAGAQSIVVEGLDANFVAISETIVTNGDLASLPTSAQFLRVLKAYVLDTGTYGGSNTGDIIIETTGGVTVAAMEALISATQIAAYTVPAATTAFIYGFVVVVDSSKNVEVQLLKRESADTIATPFTAWRLISQSVGVAGIVPINRADGPLRIPEKTDIRFSALANANASAINVEFDIVLVKN